ncbi:4-hydroxy-tetrahydrodipicolinate synthase [Uliginosibacterium sp. H3]|uniref:4-hydroxy-tetrahydrodipicolinate synthase n=1 Tax=Uliginosibacterium silvisoli TaxID=3114758 RepID=A0ABU6K152_9RHOO|nr:4-hydroxy-tetrahydrodipicolinate synthase [Uliginosibacterium sp. H3]
MTAANPATTRNSLFEGIWVPIVTPFRHGAIDHEALQALARSLAADGIKGLIACATTGEGSSLSQDEQLAVFRSLREALGPDYPIGIGMAEIATAPAVAWARELAGLQPAALLVAVPPYLRPSQDGMRAHFEAITEAADLPVILYNIPYRTGASIDLATVQALATDARIVAIKECGASLERLHALITRTRLKVLAGDDAQIFSVLCLGGHGAISAAAHVRPDLYVRMHALLKDQRLDEARLIAQRLQPMIAALFAEPNPGPIKALFAAQGRMRDEVRLPLLPASAECLSRVQAAWKALG